MNKFNYNLDFKTTDFRKNPELYRIGVGEQGVLLVEPYKWVSSGTELDNIVAGAAGLGHLGRPKFLGDFKSKATSALDTVLARNVWWLTCLQRAMRLKLREELTQYNTPIIGSSSVISEDVTELEIVSVDTDFEYQWRPRYGADKLGTTSAATKASAGPAPTGGP